MTESQTRLEILKIAKDFLVDAYYTKEAKKIDSFYPTFQQVKELAQEMEDYVM